MPLSPNIGKTAVKQVIPCEQSDAIVMGIQSLNFREKKSEERKENSQELYKRHARPTGFDVLSSRNQISSSSHFVYYLLPTCFLIKHVQFLEGFCPWYEHCSCFCPRIRYKHRPTAFGQQCRFSHHPAWKPNSRFQRSSNHLGWYYSSEGPKWKCQVLPHVSIRQLCLKLFLMFCRGTFFDGKAVNT